MLKSLTKFSTMRAAGLGFALAGLSQPAFAQEVPEHGIFILNSLLFLVGGFLVMFMACGFCMLEAGLVRSKNTSTQLTKNVALFSIAAIGYYLIGYNLMYPLGDWAADGYFSALFPAIAEQTIEAIRETAETGKIGDGKIFILNLEEVVRIRTGETGVDAL